MNMKYKLIESPVGKLKLVAKENALVAILWENETLNRVKLDEMVEDNQDKFLLSVEKQLNEYFQGKRTAFDLQIKAMGTAFQEKV